jgi:ATP-dependent DNA helicase RecG
MKEKPFLSLETDIHYLKGVGPKLAEVLAKREIYKIKDLIEYYPRAYEDRRAAKVIRLLKENEIVSLKAYVVKVSAMNMGKSHRKMYDILVKDSSGQVHCKFFRVPYKGYFERFRPNQEVRIIGKVLNYRGRIEFHHPDIKDIEPDEELQDDLLPIYVEIEGFSSQKILKLIRNSFENLPTDQWPKEFIPEDVLKQESLITRQQALKLLHYPDKEQAEAFHLQKSVAHQRIIFEEFFWLELYLYAKKSDLKRQKGQALTATVDSSEILLKSLGFELTNAQKRVVKEIIEDLKTEHPMNRLLQGDVGSGKTLVAWLSLSLIHI